MYSGVCVTENGAGTEFRAGAQIRAFRCGGRTEPDADNESAEDWSEYYQEEQALTEEEISAAEKRSNS